LEPSARKAKPSSPWSSHGPRAVAEQDAGGPVGPVHQPGHFLGPDHQGAFRQTTRHETVGDAERINEARADRLDVEGHAHARAQLALNDGGHRGKGHVRRRRRHDDQVDVRRRLAGVGQGLPGGLDRQVAGRLIVARLVALPDAGAFLDPFVGRVDDLGQVGVGDDLLRQVRADAGDDAASDAHWTVSPAGTVGLAWSKTASSLPRLSPTLLI
jgi:hypothetical protein